MLNPERYFDPEPTVRKVACELYREVKDLPLISPHGHVDPRLFAENNAFPDPARLLIVPDHYIFRMLYSQGISLEALGIPRTDGTVAETDSRRIWRLFAENFFLFAGTPTGIWLSFELSELFGIREKLGADTADQIYDAIQKKLGQPDFRPRAMFDRFNLEVLTTTDAAWDRLEYHRQIRESGWNSNIVPCFRPDGVTDISRVDWSENVRKLADVSGIDIGSYRSFIQALEKQRVFFKSLGAVSTDHGVEEALTLELPEPEAERLFQRVLAGKTKLDDARMFTAHMLMEMARMSCDDQLIMHLHVGALRNYNDTIFEQYGPDKGADIPVASEFTQNLRPLLNKYGNRKNFTLVLFTLDESVYARELAPLAGHFPAVRLGPAWWFHDTFQGMIRHRQNTLETAGIYNLIGFIDDTRAFAGLVARHIIDLEDAHQLNYALAYGLSKKIYRPRDSAD
jgi:glucuronate isomerase